MFRFSRDYRLAKKQDFRSVFDKAAKISRKYLTALYIPNQFGHARLGVMISKQQVKQAVQRNRLRRVVRESFRQHQHTLRALDIVVIVRPEGLFLESKLLREAMSGIWSDLS